MKTIFTLLIALMGMQLFAQNNITIFSEDGYGFYVILNGIRQNENPETNVKVNGLTADYYTAKVIFSNQSIASIEKKMLMAAAEDCKPCDVTFKIKKDKKGQLVMKMFGYTPLAQAPPPPANVAVVQYNTVPLPAPVFGVQVTETTTTTMNGSSDNVNMGVNVGGFNMDVNVNVNDGYGSTSSHTTTTTTTTLIPATPIYVEESCPPMTSSSFSSLLNSMGNKSFDDDKVLVAKQAASSNCMTASQIKAVMNALEWDDSRLDFAKHAYANCVDPQNYFQVNDAFEWDDASEELNSFIH